MYISYSTNVWWGKTLLNDSLQIVSKQNFAKFKSKLQCSNVYSRKLGKSILQSLFMINGYSEPDSSFCVEHHHSSTHVPARKRQLTSYHFCTADLLVIEVKPIIMTHFLLQDTSSLMFIVTQLTSYLLKVDLTSLTALYH